MAHMTTYMGCQVGHVVSLLGLGTVVQPLWASDPCHQDMSVGLMVTTWQWGFSPGTLVFSPIKNYDKILKQLKTMNCKVAWTLNIWVLCETCVQYVQQMVSPDTSAISSYYLFIYLFTPVLRCPLVQSCTTDLTGMIQDNMHIANGNQCQQNISKPEMVLECKKISVLNKMFASFVFAVVDMVVFAFLFFTPWYNQTDKSILDADQLLARCAATYS